MPVVLQSDVKPDDKLDAASQAETSEPVPAPSADCMAAATATAATSATSITAPHRPSAPGTQLALWFLGSIYALACIVACRGLPHVLGLGLAYAALVLAMAVFALLVARVVIADWMVALTCPTAYPTCAPVAAMRRAAVRPFWQFPCQQAMLCRIWPSL